MNKIQSFSNDFVEYYYYPESLNDSSQLTFTMIKENEVITAYSWNTYNSQSENQSVQIQVPRLTISVWSGKFETSVCFKYIRSNKTIKRLGNTMSCYNK